MKVRIVRCGCSYMANLDEATNLVWVTLGGKKRVVCPGNGRGPCGIPLEPKTKEFKGLKLLRSHRRPRAPKEMVAA